MKKLLILSLFTFFLNQANAQIWGEAKKVVAFDRKSLDHFGTSVSISGDYAIVGSYTYYDDTGGSSLANAGGAYIFEKDGSDNWIYVQKIVAADRAQGAYLGWSVSISGDYVIVGAPYEKRDETGGSTMEKVGSAYIFERDGSGYWNEVQKIVSSDRDTSDNFGWTVSISGNYAIVAAIDENENEIGTDSINAAGSVYVFERDTSGNWIEVQKIVASDRGRGDRFGLSLSISENYLIVGTRYEDHDVAGADSLSDAGSAYIFERDSIGNWMEVKKLVANDRASLDWFGYSVSISGEFAIVGAMHESEDTTGANTMANAGSGYIYARDGSGNWNQAQKIVPSDREAVSEFGNSVSITGEYIIVGAWNEDEDGLGKDSLVSAGGAYLFKWDGSVWNQLQKIVSSDREESDNFGTSVSINANNAIVGARWEDEDAVGGNYMTAAGSAYIFKNIQIPNLSFRSGLS